MKIGISGTHGAGKTTLAKKLADYFNMPYIPEKARESAEKLGIENMDEAIRDKDLMSTFQWDVLRRQLNAEARAFFVSDRTVVDNLAYYVINNNDDVFTVSKYMDIVFSSVVEYDLIIFLEAFGEIENDGFRNINGEYQNVIEQEIMSKLKLYEENIKNIYMPESIKPEDRYEECKEVILKLGEGIPIENNLSFKE